MNQVLFACLLGAGLVSWGESLICNFCPLSMPEKCLGNTTETETVTCGENERCAIAYLNSSTFTLKSKGCLLNTLCGFETDLMVPNILNNGSSFAAKAKTTCCNTDRCNGATSLTVLLSAVMGTALLALWGGSNL